jgi:tetratricopeptide (TPR) repeat protein
VIQTGLGQLDEAKKSLKSAISQLEDLCNEDTKNDNNQRNRMLGYSHLAELLINQKDELGAAEAFQSMVGVAETRYKTMPSDQGASYDYAMALGRSAGLKSRDAATRLDLYAQSTRLLADSLQRDPANGSARVNLAAHKDSMGDLLMAIGQQGAALNAYRESLRIIEERPVKVAAGPRVAIAVSAKLAEYMAKQGDFTQAIATAKHTLSIAEKIGNSDPVVNQVQRARAYESMANVQALFKHPQEAHEWRLRALNDYRKLAVQPEFPKAARARMTALEKLIEAGDKRK